MVDTGVKNAHPKQRCKKEVDINRAQQKDASEVTVYSAGGTQHCNRPERPDDAHIFGAVFRSCDCGAVNTVQGQGCTWLAGKYGSLFESAVCT